jgi:hypothetical protein
MNPADVAAENILLVMPPELLKFTGELHGVVGGHDAQSIDETRDKKTSSRLLTCIIFTIPTLLDKMVMYNTNITIGYTKDTRI